MDPLPHLCGVARYLALLSDHGGVRVLRRVSSLEPQLPHDRHLVLGRERLDVVNRLLLRHSRQAHIVVVVYEVLVLDDLRLCWRLSKFARCVLMMS